MKVREWLFRGITSVTLCAGIYAQEPAHNAAEPGLKQRLNTVVQRRDSATNQNASDSYDPLTFYRKNPELMKRYFPHLYAGANPAAPMQVTHPNNGGETTVLEAFRFNGGTATEFVEMLKGHLDVSPNIIIAPKLRDTPIPELELKKVTLADIFQALNTLSEDKSIQWQLSGSTEPIWVLNPAPGALNTPAQVGGAGFPGASGFGMPGMMVDPLTGAPIPLNNGRICQILPLGKYLGEYKVEDITTAVKTAWSMMGDDAGAQLKYHTDTKLLIAVGTSGQLSILSQVLSSLETSLDHAEKRTDARKPNAGSVPKF